MKVCRHGVAQKGQQTKGKFRAGISRKFHARAKPMSSMLNITSTIKAAQGAQAADEAAPEKPEKKDKPVSLRMPETELNHFRSLFAKSELNHFRSLFAKSELNLSEGCIMAITYVAEMIEAGAFTIS